MPNLVEVPPCRWELVVRNTGLQISARYYLQRFSKVMGIDQILRASSQSGNGLFERQFGCFNRGFHKLKGQDRFYRVYLVYIIFLVILSVVLVPPVKKAVLAIRRNSVD